MLVEIYCLRLKDFNEHDYIHAMSEGKLCFRTGGHNYKFTDIYPMCTKTPDERYVHTPSNIRLKLLF